MQSGNDDLPNFGYAVSHPPPKRSASRQSHRALTNSQSNPMPSLDPFQNTFDDPFMVQPDFFDVSAVSAFSPSPTSSGQSTPYSRRSSANSSTIQAELFDPQMWGSYSVSKREDSHSSKGRRSRRNSGRKSRKGSASPAPTLEQVPERKTSSEVIRTPSNRSIEDAAYTNTLPILHLGMSLLKYPRRRGDPHFRHVQLMKDNRHIQYYTRKKSLQDSCIPISSICEITEGQVTETFRQYAESTISKASFSVVYGMDFSTFDVVAKSVEEKNIWVLTLRKLVELHRMGEDLSQLDELKVEMRFKDYKAIRRVSQREDVNRKALADMKKRLNGLRKTFSKCDTKLNRPHIANSVEYNNIGALLSELESRIEALASQIELTPQHKVTRRDMWRAEVDASSLMEKMNVILKYYNSSGEPKT